METSQMREYVKNVTLPVAKEISPEVYNKQSFRMPAADFANRYFIKKGRHYMLIDEIKDETDLVLLVLDDILSSAERTERRIYSIYQVVVIVFAVGVIVALFALLT